ncbi:MAG: DNA-binding protein [Desulfuromonadaceae bacterium]|nr:DNA-binding protein [Desulfuromonadaceae bacterium]
MKRTTTSWFLIALLALGLGACKEEKATTAAPEAAPPVEAAAAQPPADAGQLSGTVVETMNTAGYTYVSIQTGDKTVWVAAPEFSVKVGDPVIVADAMPMPNYHSKTLNRDFDLVYFASGVAVAGCDMSLSETPAGGMGGMASPHGRPAAPTVEIDFSGLEKPVGGYTVAEIYAQKDALANKEISLRGKVVKFSPRIMKTNWLHVQDGTGDEASHDLTITSSVEVQQGDTVVVKGILDLNQDFGYGYKYDLIIQNASVTVE